MTDISELIERVEKASGPDRELDGDIAVMVGLYARRPVVSVPPAYTASIDAALTLLPDGCGWMVRWPFDGPPTNSYISWPDTPLICGKSTTPALALVAACLKARLAMSATQDTEARHD